MKKILMFLGAAVLSLSAYAWEYTAQCKVNSRSYVVASQESNGQVVKLNGYGDCANCKVIITTVPKNDPSGTSYTYSVVISNGSGEVYVNPAWRVSRVDNIVCSPD